MSEGTATRKQSSRSERVVDAMPTKALFIEMLTRDIQLVPAILDLVDNAIDGARRLRGEGSFKGLSVRVQVSPRQLRVVDNCGGIEVDLARRYAFRFGRPLAAPSVRHSIGRFGVGMKRAFFKLGRRFHVESVAARSSFAITVDVPKWAQHDRWEFEFDKVQRHRKSNATERGTTVVVSDLHEDVAEELGLTNFRNSLGNQIRARLQDALDRGMAITVNQIPVNARPLELLDDEKIAPAHRRKVYRRSGAKPVVVELYCGLGASEGKEARARAGWHVFCNGRLVLEADKSAVTGWGEHRETRIPGFHGQYNYFRGFAYFDCDDPDRLPWNTTKTGLDQDSPIYRAVRLEMMNLMRPVIDFLNKLKEEKQQTTVTGEEGPLEMIVKASGTSTLPKTKTRDTFATPRVKKPKAPSGPVMQGIQYDAPYDKVVIAMRTLRVRTYRAVGKETFNYYFEAECEET